VEGAEVTAFWEPPPLTFQPGDVPRSTTGPDGKFLLQVPAGGYRLTAVAPGYVRQEYGAALAGYAGSRTGTVFNLNPGDSVRDLTLRLTSDSILAGRVISTDGLPLLRVEVVALKRRFAANGVSSLEAQGRAETDDRGEYRIAGLGPGAYYVWAASLYPGILRLEQRRATREGVPAPATPTPGFYAPVYYPSADHSSRASLVEIQAGTEVRNIDFVLPKQQTYSVRGRVSDPSTGGLPVRAPMIASRPANDEYLSGAGASVEPYRPDGTFELTGLTPGIHRITAQIPAPPLTAAQRQLLGTPGADRSQLPLPVRAAALVRVADADVENVELTFVRDLELSGRLIVEAEAFDFDDARNVKLELRPVDPVGNGLPVGFTWSGEDGSFVYSRLMPMEFQLAVSALPRGLYVKEARFGRADALTDSILLLKPPQDLLEIVLARGAELTGTVVDASATPIANQEVVLIPDVRPNRPDLYKTAVTDSAGRFAMQGVAPGEYGIFAWQKIESFQYFDEAFVSRYQELGSQVLVTGTARADVRVVLIP
jgi:hypothetical protein